MMHKNTARIHDADLYYELSGSGNPLVLIHGFSLDHRMWEDQFLAFAEQFRVLRYDIRGFGRSSQSPRTPYSHVDDLKELLKYLDLDHATLVGFSMGAEIALELALEKPQQVNGLVLAGAFLQDFQWQTFGEDYRSVIEAGRTSGVQAAKDAWLTLEVFRPGMGHPTAGARLKQMVQDYSGWHFTHKDPKRRPRVPIIQRLDQIRAETMVAVGEDDLEDFQNIADLLQRQIPKAQRVDISAGGHFITMENADRFNHHVLQFLANVVT